MKPKIRPLLTVISVLLLAGGALLFCSKTTVIELINLDHNRVLLVRISPSERFSMFYVHSIYDAYVLEEFEAGSETVILKGVRTESPRVMEYYGFDSVKGFHPLNIALKQPLIIRRGMGRNQGFIFNGKKVHLSEFAEKGDRIQMRLTALSRGAYFLNKFLEAPPKIPIANQGASNDR